MTCKYCNTEYNECVMKAHLLLVHRIEQAEIEQTETIQIVHPSILVKFYKITATGKVFPGTKINEDYIWLETANGVKEIFLLEELEDAPANS